MIKDDFKIVAVYVVDVKGAGPAVRAAERHGIPVFEHLKPLPAEECSQQSEEEEEEAMMRLLRVRRNTSRRDLAQVN